MIIYKPRRISIPTANIDTIWLTANYILDRENYLKIKTQTWQTIPFITVLSQNLMFMSFQQGEDKSEEKLLLTFEWNSILLLTF
jgi:hypothetical protein